MRIHPVALVKAICAALFCAALLHSYSLRAGAPGGPAAGSASSPTAVTANAGRDTTLPFSQMNAVTQLPLKGNASGTITSWKWTKISGGNVTIANAAAQNTVATGFQPGNYSFQLTVSDGVTSATDIVNVRVVDYQKKGEGVRRVGAPVVWTLKPTANNTIFYPYLRRDGYSIMAGDTIKIPAGTYSGISLGDFGGVTGYPVVIVPAGLVTITGSTAYFRLGSGIGDSNFVSHVFVDGNYLQSKGIKYGFQFINGAPSPATIGFTANLATDIEVCGMYMQNTGVGVMAKLDSDSSRPWRIYNNFYMKNLKFHDLYIRRTTGEGMYLGHTSPQGDGSVQAGNDGPTVRIDSIEVNNVMIDSSGWDGIQVSNAIYASIHDNIVYRSGSSNVGSQRAWIIMGGNTTGKIYNNVGYNLKEGIRGTPYGNVELYNNYGDSIKIGGTSDDGVYMTGIATGPGTNIIEPRPLFKPYAHDNIFARTERFDINFPNSYGFNTPGQISNNSLVDPTKTLTQLIGSAGDLIQNNVIYKTFPVALRSLSSVTVGPKIVIQLTDSTRTFTDAASAIAWLKCKLTKVCTVAPPKPTANAGIDQTVSLPVTSVNLTGVGTGTAPLAYAWTKIAGPTTPVLATPAAATTIVSGLVQGTYSFVLTVTDSYKQTAKDTVNVKVTTTTSTLSDGPVANAGTNLTITLPLSSYWLDATKSTDAGGTITSFAWTKVAGPASYYIITDTARRTIVNKLVAGVYTFQVTVTDNRGAKSTAQVTVTVNPAIATATGPAAYGAYGASFQDSTNIRVIGLYPNPTHDVLNLQWSGIQTGTRSISIFDISGRLKMKLDNSGSDLVRSISVSGLAAGVYFVRIVSADGSQPVTLKFIKQ